MNYLLPLMMLVLPFTMQHAKAVNADSLLEAERFHYYTKFRSLKDTITVNTWVNMKRMNDHLEKIVEIDNVLFDSIRSAHQRDSLALAAQQQFNQRYNDLIMEYDKLKARTDNDLNMMLYLKMAVGVLAAFIVLLIFMLIGRNTVNKRNKEKAEHYEAIFEEKRLEAEAFQVELDRMKRREKEFRDELEKGMQLNMERLQGLQEKCDQLEEDKRRLEQSAQYFPESIPGKNDDEKIALIPEDAGEMTEMIRTLSEERDSLINLAGQLQKKLENEMARRTALLERVDALVQNLSQIGKAE